MTLYTPSKLPTDFRLGFMSLLAAVIGLFSGITAFLLIRLIAVLTNLVFYHTYATTLPSFEENPLGYWLPLVTTLGGLVVGFIARFVPDIRGHGIPEAMESVVFKRSRIAPMVAFWKPISAALAIGTGGPFGAEGPIIQTGGGVGSLVGQLLSCTATERKVLLACGAAAGMAATFSTPIAAVILAIELLLFEFKSRSFIPLVVASTVATNVHFLLFGWGPLFQVSPVDFGLPGQLPFYVLLGVLCGAAAVGITRALYAVEDFFEGLPFDPIWWPALGGLFLGLIGLFVPRVLGVGYGTITDILDANLTWSLLAAVMVGKLSAMLVTLGSGTSGGLLAPTFMSTAAMGSLYAIALNQAFPSLHLAPGAFALAAMAAVFGAASRSTFAFIVFAFEITRNYNAILPLMLTSAIADGIALQWLKHSIMTEKLARRGLQVPQDYETDIWQQIAVEDVMTTKCHVLSDQLHTSGILELPFWEQQSLTPLLNEEGQLTGVLSRHDVLRALRSQDPDKILGAIGHRDIVVAYPQESLKQAVGRLLYHDVACLPVVDPDQPTRLLGLLERQNLLHAYRRRLEEEHELEPGWLSRLKD